MVTSGTIDVLEPRTAKAIEVIQRWAQDSDLAFTLRTSLPNTTELRIEVRTHFFRTEATSVESEVYLYGKVVEAGSRGKPSVHLNGDGQGVYIIDASEQVLADLKDNILYHTMGVRAIGCQNLQTGEIEKGALKLIELIDLDEKFEATYLRRLQARASSWIKDIDPDQYLNEVRGAYGSEPA